MHHVIVTRFSVPRPQDPATAARHTDRAWLDRRLELFRGYFLPSVERLHVPVMVLCSTPSSGYVASSIDDLPWAKVVVQDDWHGGWAGPTDCTVTRMDSDDALHKDWFHDVEIASEGVEVVCTKHFLRLDIQNGRLCAYKRANPSPLAAFLHGKNPYQCDHEEIERRFGTAALGKPYLLQIYHGGNVSSRRPKLFRRRAPRTLLSSFGIE